MNGFKNDFNSPATLEDLREHWKQCSEADLVVLGYALPVFKLVRLKTAGIPFRWKPLGQVDTTEEFAEEARRLLEAPEATHKV